MTQKLTSTVAVLVLILSAAGLAFAQGDQPPAVVKEGVVAQQPAVVQQVPVVQQAPAAVSRPGKFGALGIQDNISVLLTEKECKDLGGTVNDVSSPSCPSGKLCMTAGKDGVIRGVCISK